MSTAWREWAGALYSSYSKLKCDSGSFDSDAQQQQQQQQPQQQQQQQQQDLAKERKECARCERWRDDLIRSSPIVRFMLQHIALLPSPAVDGSSSSSSSSSASISSGDNALPIVCAPCPPTHAGGFNPVHGILLCQNRLMSKAHVEDALAHELVHAFDFRRFVPRKGTLDWGNDLRAHACTEIRAENLSGDCRLAREWTRRHYSLAKQHQACVRRRATLSVAANPACPSKEVAEQVVNEVWDSCFADTRPFDEIY